METTVNNGMCRCCASEGAFKDVKSTYHWMGEEEIYADMLRDCFDINLHVLEEGENGGICEVCITQLRNAINFKKQVLHTEEQFKKHIQNKSMFRPNIVKVEVHNEESDDNNASGDDAFSSEFEIPIKTEVSEEPKSKKRAAKASMTTRSKKSKVDSGETSTKRGQDNVTSEKSIDTALVIVEPKKNGVARKMNNPTKRALQEELEKHKHNLQIILNSSDATPILRRGGIGYMCSYCFKEFPDPADLKNHTLSKHDSKSDPTLGYRKSAPMSDYCVRLDITNLNCISCSTEIDSLENLLVHLKEEHDKIIHTDIKNHIIPFKFETDELTCCLCFNAFDKFKQLQEHMHKHFPNFVCDVCSAGFVNQGCLTRHAKIHLKGTFPCKYCNKVFDTYVKKVSHERCKHTHTNVLNRCGYCNEGFRDHYYKELHMIQVHGVEEKVYECNACDKSYSSRRRLRVHVKRDHLLERRHKCDQCEMSFFSTYDAKNHMIKHTGEKEFQCVVCLKFFGRRSTLTNHMRIHNNDRRFKCEICGMSFVQKCTWRGHMNAIHEISV